MDISRVLECRPTAVKLHQSGADDRIELGDEQNNPLFYLYSARRKSEIG